MCRKFKKADDSRNRAAIDRFIREAMAGRHTTMEQVHSLTHSLANDNVQGHSLTHSLNHSLCGSSTLQLLAVSVCRCTALRAVSLCQPSPVQGRLANGTFSVSRAPQWTLEEVMGAHSVSSAPLLTAVRGYVWQRPCANLVSVLGLCRCNYCRM